MIHIHHRILLAACLCGGMAATAASAASERNDPYTAAITELTFKVLMATQTALGAEIPDPRAPDNNLGFSVMCDTHRQYKLLGHLALGFHPDREIRNLHLVVRDPGGQEVWLAHGIENQNAAGYDDPILFYYDANDFLDNFLWHGSEVSNGHTTLTNRLSAEQNAALRNIVTDCPAFEPAKE